MPPFDIAILNWIPGVVWFSLKVSLILFVFLWVRATLPRYRYDQLMRLGWVFFFEIALANIFLTALILMIFG